MIRAAILALVAGLAAIATSFPWSAQPVEAREAPWCAVIGMTDDGVYWDCQYDSFEQCRAVVGQSRLVQSEPLRDPSDYGAEAQGSKEPQLLNIATSRFL
jgi:hypothetical protein